MMLRMNYSFEIILCSRTGTVGTGTGVGTVGGVVVGVGWQALVIHDLINNIGIVISCRCR